MSSMRIAKMIGRTGLLSRRKAEEAIASKRVKLNGELVITPAIKVSEIDVILVDGKKLPEIIPTQIWMFHKPRGCLTTTSDLKDRKTVYDLLPSYLKDFITVGRLDYNTRGLLLFTNDGALKRTLELPKSKIARRYRVRVKGKVAKRHLIDTLKNGLQINGFRYAPIDCSIVETTQEGATVVLKLREGKNREIRKVMEYFGLTVIDLIRIGYGPYSLQRLPEGSCRREKVDLLRDVLTNTPN